MGWSNYIIVDSLKVIIETYREIDDIEDYEIEVIDKIIEYEDEDAIRDENFVDMTDIKINEITIGNLVSMFNAYKHVTAISGISTDKFLLYWLKSKNIAYEIEFENNVDLKLYRDNGYAIILKGGNIANSENFLKIKEDD